MTSETQFDNVTPDDEPSQSSGNSGKSQFLCARTTRSNYDLLPFLNEIFDGRLRSPYIGRIAVYMSRFVECDCPNRRSDCFHFAENDCFECLRQHNSDPNNYQVHHTSNSFWRHQDGFFSLFCGNVHYHVFDSPGYSFQEQVSQKFFEVFETRYSPVDWHENQQRIRYTTGMHVKETSIKIGMGIEAEPVSRRSNFMILSMETDEQMEAVHGSCADFFNRGTECDKSEELQQKTCEQCVSENLALERECAKNKTIRFLMALSENRIFNHENNIGRNGGVCPALRVRSTP